MDDEPHDGDNAIKVFGAALHGSFPVVPLVGITIVTESGVVSEWMLLEVTYAEDDEAIVTVDSGGPRKVIVRFACGELQVLATQGNRQFALVLPRLWPADVIEYAHAWCAGGGAGGVERHHGISRVNIYRATARNDAKSSPQLTPLGRGAPDNCVGLGGRGAAAQGVRAKRS